jgi:hypothetical protein
MANMSYCRFRNTLTDLKDCYDNLWDEDLSPEEERARERLIIVCHGIASDTQDEYEELTERK